MIYDQLVGTLEAVLFAAGEPMSVGELATAMSIEKPQVWELLSTLEQEYKAENRGLMVREIAGGYQLVTKPEHYTVVASLSKTKEVKLTNASMETLAIIAMKQPVTRAEVEAVRGVKAERALSTLLDLDLIQEVGRKKALGNPILYGTTEKFLTVFGLASLEQLPLPKELDQLEVNLPEQLTLEPEEGEKDILDKEANNLN